MMKTPRIQSHAILRAALFLGCLATCVAARAAGAMEVIYVDPDSFIDAGRDSSSRGKTLQKLDAHFLKMAERLPEGRTLRLQINDIDLAGALDMSRTYDYRVLSERDWPHIYLHFTLMAAGNTLKEGEVHLTSRNYFQYRRPTYLGSSDLMHERRMLDEWFDKEILAP